MTISYKLHPTLSLQNSYLQISQLLESCTSQEECIQSLLENNHYRLVYPQRKLDSLTNQCFYHFIRSRIALFQKDSFWFQKEIKALVTLWLQNEAYFAHSLNQLGTLRLIKLGSFSDSLDTIEFTVFFEEQQVQTEVLSSNLRSVLFYWA